MPGRQPSATFVGQNGLRGLTRRGRIKIRLFVIRKQFDKVPDFPDPSRINQINGQLGRGFFLRLPTRGPFFIVLFLRFLHFFLPFLHGVNRLVIHPQKVAEVTEKVGRLWLRQPVGVSGGVPFVSDVGGYATVGRVPRQQRLA